MRYACSRGPHLPLPAWRPAPAVAGTPARLQRRYGTGSLATARRRNIAQCTPGKIPPGHVISFASMRKLLAKHQRSIAHVAGAPACPCLPGGQRPPQQAPSPGSKEDMKREALLRHSKGTSRHVLYAKRHVVTLYTSLRCESHLPGSNVALRWWQGPPPAPACLAPSACRSRHTRQTPETI